MTPYWCPLHMIVNVKLSMHEKIQDFGHESSKGVGAWIAHKANEEKRINLARIALFFPSWEICTTIKLNVVGIFSLDSIS